MMDAETDKAADMSQTVGPELRGSVLIRDLDTYKTFTDAAGDWLRSLLDRDLALTPQELSLVKAIQAVLWKGEIKATWEGGDNG